jgi:hypothetical protein
MGARDRRVRTRVNATGRRKQEPFVSLRNFLIDSPAYLDLDARAKAALLFLKRHFNGRNNGFVHASSRKLARFLHCSKDNALRALTDLEDHGFIRLSQRGSFHWKQRHAPTWILNDEAHNGESATNDFMRWGQPNGQQSRPRKRNLGPPVRTARSSTEDSAQ